MPPVSLDTFVGAAERFAAANPDQALRLEGEQVADVGRFRAYFGKEANRATLDSFVDAVRDKYGESAGSAIRNMLHGARVGGKPLTARMTQDMIRAGQRKADMLPAREFINGSRGSGGPGLDQAVDALCRDNDLPETLSANPDLDKIVNVFCARYKIPKADKSALMSSLSELCSICQRRPRNPGRAPTAPNSA